MSVDESNKNNNTQEKATKNTSPPLTNKEEMGEFVRTALWAIALALVIRSVFLEPFNIPSGSMKPTLLVGDHILVNKFLYGIKLPFTDKILISLGEPERGDVVVFKFPLDTRKDYIKRVIGLPGDRVELVDKQLLINGRPTEDPHASYSMSGSMRMYGPVTVPADHLFVMGDNRDESSDSRVWGFVPRPYLKGKAFLIYWSWDRKNYGVRWNRLADIVR